MILSMISSNTGCQMSIARNAMNVVESSIPSEEDIIVEYVDKYFVADAVVKKYLGKEWDLLVS